MRQTSKSAIFTTFGPLWPWGWIGSYGIPSYITHRPLSTHQILLKSEKLCGRMDVRTDIETGFIWSTTPNQPKYTCLCPTRSLQITTSMKSFKDLLIFQYSTYSTETITELVSLQILCTELLPISTKIYTSASSWSWNGIVLVTTCIVCIKITNRHIKCIILSCSVVNMASNCSQLKESSANTMFVMLFWVPWIQQPCLSISCHLSSVVGWNFWASI